MTRTRIQSLIHDIRCDNTSGSTALTRKAAEALSLSDEPRETARALIAAQPTMASIVNLAKSSLSPLEFADAFMSHGQAAIRHAAELIRDGQTVLTHSFSSAVMEALLAAHRLGRRFEAICLESRPICEGHGLAKELGANGIPVTLLVDAAMLSALERSALVLVGADSVSASGVINKTGTAGLAALAASAGVPFYVICTSEKVLPANYALPDELPKPAAELGVAPEEPIRTENLYFDCTPLDGVTGIITEDGMVSPKDFIRGSS